MLNRILRGIIIFILLSFAYIVYMGLTNESSQVITEVEIATGPADVYRVLVDPQRAGEWLTGLSSIERISGEEMAEGAQYRIVFIEGGKAIEMTETVRKREEDRLLVFDLESEFMISNMEISLEPTETGTLVREVQTISGKDFMTRAMTGTFKRSIAERSRMIYGNLKELVED
jgi:uncharacterized protein YndB with AHSA1/START domain